MIFYMPNVILILLSFMTELGSDRNNHCTDIFFFATQSSSVHYCRNSKPLQSVINSYCFNYEKEKKISVEDFAHYDIVNKNLNAKLSSTNQTSQLLK